MQHDFALTALQLRSGYVKSVQTAKTCLGDGIERLPAFTREATRPRGLMDLAKETLQETLSVLYLTYLFSSPHP